MNHYSIAIYRDEKNIIITTFNKVVGGMLYFMTDYSFALPRDSEFEKIGRVVLGAFNYIKALKPVEKKGEKAEPWKKHSKYKSWKQFILNTAQISVYITQENEYWSFGDCP